MLDGHRRKYDRLKAIQGRAIAHNHASLCLPVYRSLIAKNTELLAPVIQEFIDKHTHRVGRPGHNAVAAAYLHDIGPRKSAALALSVTVNHFHRPMSFQSLAVKIGGEIANEWILQQEDPALIERINKYRFKAVGTQRKMDYLKRTLKDIKGKALEIVPTIARAAIGNAMLSFIVRTPLVECTKSNGRDLYTITATKDVIDFLNSYIADISYLCPISFPTYDVPNTQKDYVIKPQKGRPKSESYIENSDCDLIKAAQILNSTGWTVNKEQYDFIKECSMSKTSILGLPYIFDRPFPIFDPSMTKERIRDIKRARAKLYSERNENTAKRARLLSGLSVLHNFIGKSCYFETEADFRGRLYLTSELVSYQGPDWLRSIWEFDKGEPINDQEQLDWLYIHTANCYGYNRISYSDRISFITSNYAAIIAAANDPWNNRGFLEKAEDPFRFLAACREVKNFSEGSWGTISKLPVQLDATSQGIQIWATLAGDKELMLASNVLPSEGNKPRDIYQEFANTINEIALTSNEKECAFFRMFPITRKLAKSVLMILPYGGTRHAIMEIVDKYKWNPPLRARVWISKTLWEQACDVLSPLLKMQQRASQAVSDHHRECPQQMYYEWKLPNGLTVRQRYMKDKRVRITNVIGQTIHAYRIETDTLDRRKSARAFPANLVHSIDSSVLCRSLNTITTNYPIKHFMAIHDCVGVHAANAPIVHKELSQAFKEILNDQLIKDFFSEFSCNGPELWYVRASEVKEAVKLSDYLFS